MRISSIAVKLVFTVSHPLPLVACAGVCRGDEPITLSPRTLRFSKHGKETPEYVASGVILVSAGAIEKKPSIKNGRQPSNVAGAQPTAAQGFAFMGQHRVKL